MSWELFCKATALCAALLFGDFVVERYTDVSASLSKTKEAKIDTDFEGTFDRMEGLIGSKMSEESRSKVANILQGIKLGDKLGPNRNKIQVRDTKVTVTPVETSNAAKR